MAAYPCRIENNSGDTIWIKIVGWHWDMFSMPMWPGAGNDGALYAAGAQQGYNANLMEGDRVVVIFNKTGDYLSTAVIKVSSITTIVIGPGGVITGSYSAGAPVAGGN